MPELGGMSWYSTAEYYQVINEQVQQRLGGHHSADLLVHSLDFAAIRQCRIDGDWDRAGKILAASAQGLVAAGAQLLVLATNLMHRSAQPIEDAARDAAGWARFLHIADAVAHRAAALGAQRVGLLGTSPVMEDGFYQERLARAGITALVPAAATRRRLDEIIFGELTVGTARPESQAQLAAAAHQLADSGAQAVVLACTELELAVTDSDSPVPLIPTARTHALRAVDLALAA